MSLYYRICRSGIQSLLTHPSNKFILRHKLDINSLPLLCNKSLAHFSSDNGNNIKIVYEGPLTKQIRSVKLFTLITSLSGFIAQPVIYERAHELEVSAPIVIGLCSFVGFFTFITPFLLHFVTKKYVTQITYDEERDVYTATVITLLLRRREISFKPGEPVVPDVLGMFTSMSVHGNPLFVDARYFEDISHYKKIMGYDKPIDFKLATPDKRSGSH